MAKKQKQKNKHGDLILTVTVTRTRVSVGINRLLNGWFKALSWHQPNYSAVLPHVMQGRFSTDVPSD